jgi:hypothetical protein
MTYSVGDYFDTAVNALALKLVRPPLSLSFSLYVFRSLCDTFEIALPCASHYST